MDVSEATPSSAFIDRVLGEGPAATTRTRVISNRKYEKAFSKALAEAIAEHAKCKEQRSGGGEPSCDGDAPGARFSRAR